MNNPSNEYTLMGDQIKLNGVYYAIYKNPNDNQIEMAYFFFYSNSIALFEHTGSVDNDSTNKIEYIQKNIDKDISFKKISFTSKNAGGFKIDSNHISIQIFRYIPNLSWVLCTFKGDIINDTVLYISSCELKKRADYCRSGFYLKFIEMQKPDSTNQIMKKKWYWTKN